MRFKPIVLVLILALLACAGPQSLNAVQPADTSIPATQRPLPTFPPYQTRTPTTVPRSTDTPTPFAVPLQLDTATPTIITSGIKPNPIGSSAPNKPMSVPSNIARANVPSILKQALSAAGVLNPKVYWFTFNEGDREQALMITYDSPLPHYDTFQPMFRAAKLVAAQYYLPIDPPLYSLFIATTDLTGQSAVSARLRRSSVEKWASGKIGTDDLLNNYFEDSKPVFTCTPDGCTAKMATPFVFHFPPGFPTPKPD
jgi:hypothetical protein